MSSSDIDPIVETLLESYHSGGANTHAKELPTRRDVERILELTEAILFPGFSKDESLTHENMPFVTGDKLYRLRDAVRRQVRRALMFKHNLHGEDGHIGHVEADVEAAAFAQTYIEFIPGLREMVLKDVDALCAGDPAVQYREEVMLAYPGLAATVTYRIANYFWERGMRLIARMMSENIHSKTGIDIHPAAQIGAYFYIDHGTGIVIGETSIIGNNVKIYQGVSLGALSVSRKVSGIKRHPTIEDDVTIYAGATILGGETVVGQNSIIGGNVWLINSVPAYSVVENDAIVRIRDKGRKKRLEVAQDGTTGAASTPTHGDSEHQAAVPQKERRSKCLASMLEDLSKGT